MVVADERVAERALYGIPELDGEGPASLPGGAENRVTLGDLLVLSYQVTVPGQHRVGASGAGRSSLRRAGLLPAISRGES